MSLVEWDSGLGAVMGNLGGVAVFPFLLAIMVFFFGQGALTNIGVSPELQQQIFIGIIIIAAVTWLVTSLFDAREKQNFVTTLLNNFFGLIVLAGFAFDFVSSVVGLNTALQGASPATPPAPSAVEVGGEVAKAASGKAAALAKQAAAPPPPMPPVEAGGVGIDPLSMGLAFFIALAVFVIIFSVETGTKGQLPVPKWVYLPLFVVASAFDVVTSVYGFYVLFGLSSEELLSPRMGILVFASILVYFCQFAVLHFYVKNEPFIQPVRRPA